MKKSVFPSPCLATPTRRSLSCLPGVVCSAGSKAPQRGRQLRKTFLSITQSGATHTAAAAAVTQRGESAVRSAVPELHNAA
ncbi:hypothetical protein J6590_078282 [Homalodisca vitripennis]|nr:hypothetical protein J6590_078282 [Homalodisca vitripennis]